MKKQIAQYSIKMGESNERKKEKMREKKANLWSKFTYSKAKIRMKKGSFKNHLLKYKIVKSMGRESMGLLYKRFTENYGIYHNVENKLQ